MRLECAFRENDPFGIADETLFGNIARSRHIGKFEEGRCVANARRRPHDNRRAVSLRQLVGGLYHLASLIGGCGIEHRHLGKSPEPAGILFGLRRDGTRIISDEQHGAAFDTDVVQAHKRVACNVETHLLAGEQRSRPRISRSRQQLERRLLVG